MVHNFEIVCITECLVSSEDLHDKEFFVVQRLTPSGEVFRTDFVIKFGVRAETYTDAILKGVEIIQDLELPSNASKRVQIRGPVCQEGVARCDYLESPGVICSFNKTTKEYVGIRIERNRRRYKQFIKPETKCVIDSCLALDEKWFSLYDQNTTKGSENGTSICNQTQGNI